MEGFEKNSRVICASDGGRSTAPPYKARTQRAKSIAVEFIAAAVPNRE